VLVDGKHTQADLLDAKWLYWDRNYWNQQTACRMRWLGCSICLSMKDIAHHVPYIGRHVPWLLENTSHELHFLVPTPPQQVGIWCHARSSGREIPTGLIKHVKYTLNRQGTSGWHHAPARQSWAYLLTAIDLYLLRSIKPPPATNASYVEFWASVIISNAAIVSRRPSPSFSAYGWKVVRWCNSLAANEFT
jgi:hypothetical protein